MTVGSYAQKEWTIDVGGPVSKELAYRFSYSGTDSKGYWQGDYYNKNHSTLRSPSPSGQRKSTKSS